jgi:hypothetical protein
MPLFEVSADGLIPFRQLESGAGAYDEAIEDVLWRNLDGLIGERLFRVRRQAPLDGGGRPAVVALDPDGSIVVVHARRQIDRTGLAECLEYAGWARAASMDELAALYWRGESEFWGDWQGFLGHAAARQLKPTPRLFLATGDFTSRAQSTFEFLVDNGLPVKVLKATVYESADGRRVLDVDGPADVESVIPSRAAQDTFDRLSRSARRSAERALERAPETNRPAETAPLPSGDAAIGSRPHRFDPPPGLPLEPALGRASESPLDRAPEPPAGQVAEPVVGRAPEQPLGRANEPQLGRAAEPPLGRAPEPPLGRAPEMPLGRVPEMPLGRVTEPQQGRAPEARELGRAPEPPLGRAPEARELGRAPEPLGRAPEARELGRAPEGRELGNPVERGQRELERAPERPDQQPPSRRGPDALQDPLVGGLLPPASPSAPLTADQLRDDPLGVDQIVAGQLAGDQDRPPPVNPFGRGAAAGHRPVGASVSEPTGENPYHRSAPPNGRGAHPVQPPPGAPQQGMTPPGMMPPPPAVGRPMPPQDPSLGFDPPTGFDPDHPDLRPGPPRRGPFAGGPTLSVVPPTPDPGAESDAQAPEPPPTENLEPGDDRPERTRLSDIMDPRMLRVPDGFTWSDPRTANGKRDSGNRDNGR